MSVILWISLILISYFTKELLSSESYSVLADDIQYRLPNDTKPEIYDVFISTNVHNDDFTFEGIVSILISVISDTASITLHSHRQRNIYDISLLAEDGIEVIQIGTATYNSDNDFLTIPLLTGVLEAGKRYWLNIVFSGTLQEEPRGFYRSSYIDDNGTVRYLATTQFALTDARHGFPCYDEPSFRANFTIRIRHGSEYHAVSNMPVNTSINQGGMITTTFLTTPSSPTYILAYTISDFHFKSNENTSSGSIPFKTYARQNAIDGASYSVEIGEKLLMAYNNYFGIEFVLPKMDQVAVQDFPFSAMENWGMVVYKEPFLLLFPNSTHAAKTTVTTIIAHEFAHQWFGNLVTPKWWTYTWLSEGFSTLFEHLATDWIFPEWKINHYYVFDTLQYVFQADSEDTTHSMSSYAESPEEILRLLDDITYAKASCILRMMMHAITEEIFKSGLINYFKANAFLAVDEDDLFEAISQSISQNNPSANSINISAIMSSWTQQKGFPFLTISRNYHTGSISIRQDRYQSYIPQKTDPTLWWIPYNFASASSADFLSTSAEGWLSKSDRSITISQSGKWKEDDWIIFNKQETGYYRVLYDDENYRLIIKELVEGNFTTIHLTSRSQLVDDAFNFAKTGRLNYSVVLELMNYLKKEKEYVPWASAFRGLEFVHKMVAASSHYNHIKNFTLSLVENLFDYVGIKDLADDEPHFHKELRIMATNWACRMGSEACLKSSNAELRQNWNNIHSNMRPTIYCNGLRSSAEDDFISMKSMLVTTVDLNERNSVLTALGCSMNQTQLIDYIQSSVEDSYISESENYRVFTSVLRNGQLGLNIAVQFLGNYLLEAAVAYGAANINNAVIATATDIVSSDIEEQFSSILQMAATYGLITDETIAQAENILQGNRLWVVNHQKTIDDWLENFHSSDGNSSATVSYSKIITLATFVMLVFYL